MYRNIFGFAGTLFTEVIQLRVLERKLHCGSLKALWTGKAAFILGSMNKLLSVEPFDC